jgi:hypothetical protein
LEELKRASRAIRTSALWKSLPAREAVMDLANL